MISRKISEEMRYRQAEQKCFGYCVITGICWNDGKKNMRPNSRRTAGVLCLWRRCTGSHISNICWIFFCKIYGMALDGWDCMRIAKQLMDDKVPIIRVKSNTECDVNYYSWGSARISYILRNPFYKAHIWSAGHIRKGFAPTPMTNYPP